MTLAALAVLIISFATPATAHWRASVDSLYSVAELHYQGAEYSAAARLYEETSELIGTRAPEELGPYFENLRARSMFLSARSLQRAGDWEQAVDAYEAALPLLEPIGDAVRFHLADCRVEMGDLDGAVGLLREIVEDGVETSFDDPAFEELGDTYRRFSEWDLAVQWYRLLLARTPSYNDQALLHYKIGLTHDERGDHKAAIRSYRTAVNNYPRSRHAHDAMKKGRNISRSFTDRYHQGLVLYNRKLYRDAAEFFSHYLKHDDEGTWQIEATYFLGRSHQRQGRYGTAARRYGEAVEIGTGGGVDSDGLPVMENEHYHLAWSKLAYCRRALGNTEESLATYDEYVAMHPHASEAADAIWDKARFLEDEQRWTEAALEFARLADEYPRSDRAADGRFRAGLVLYKEGLVEEAESAFAEVSAGADDADIARALYWVGKTREELGRTEEALIVYSEAAEFDRDSFYGRRATGRLVALGAVDAPRPRASLAQRSSEMRARPIWGNGEVREFSVWLAAWSEHSYVPVEHVAVRQELVTEPTFVRADHLRALHMNSHAAEEFSRLEGRIGDDPTQLAMLIEYYERRGLHKRGIRVAERILRMSPAEGLSDAPLYLRKRICPMHFGEFVEVECMDRDVDPNTFYSLMRQESLFEYDAVSWVGARGLSQIMPSTGRWIARRLDHGRFRLSHLMDPSTNVRFGVYYLSEQLKDFDGDAMRALAAYNGGPSNVQRWWAYGGCEDTDVFVEDIGYSETADYVRRVYLYGQFYEEIYGRSFR